MRRNGAREDRGLSDRDNALIERGAVHTFLLADLVGYTALTEAMGDESAADVAANFRRVVVALLPAYDAAEIKTIGDALLVRVPDPGAAIQLAARIEAEFGSTHESLGVRVGLHTGSAVERHGDWFGSGVNLAARVAEQAQPGEVLMTASTAERARRWLVEGQLESRGTRELKNIPAPVELFALVPDPARKEHALPVDPVCRMAVDPTLTPLSEQYQQVEYHFCSDACRLAFLEDPRRYIRAARWP